MKNRNMKLCKNIIIIFIIFMFLFPNYKVFAETIEINGNAYTYVTPDDNQDGADVSEVEFELTNYGGDVLGGVGLRDSDFTVNSKYGWREYEQDGVKYVVIAAATHEMLQSPENNYYYDKYRFDHIHYFRYYQKIKFKFKDTNFDSNVYNGIILDSCGGSMFPQASPWNRGPKANILDIYYGNSGEANFEVISGKSVDVSLDGTFSQKAAESANINSVRKWWSNWLTNKLINGADMLQRWMDSNTTGNDCRELTYSFNETKAIQDKEQEKDEIKAIEDYNQENILKIVDLSKNIENRKGISTTAFNKTTPIPVIQTDVYSMTNGKIDVFDINFYSKKENEFGTKKMWDFIRTVVVSYSKISIYFSIALILTLLIFTSITFVLHIYGRNSRRSKKFKRNN